jgi:hypothetical protein
VAKKTGERRDAEDPRPLLVTSPIADPNDWRPARPTKAQLMAGR